MAYINDSTSTGIAGYSNDKETAWRVNDLKIVINKLAQLRYIQWDNIGLWAYHSGGSAATLLQMQSDNIRAVISIEGSEGWMRETNGFPDLKQYPLYNPDRMKVPYMRFQSTNPEPNWYISTPKKTTWELYDKAKHAKIYRVILSKSEHDDLGDGVWESVIPDKKQRNNHEQRLLLSYGLNFFDHYLKHKQKSGKFLHKQPSAYGFEESFATINYTSPSSLPPSSSDLKRTYDNKGIQAMESIVKENLNSDNPVITTKILADIAQNYVWSEKNDLAGLEIIIVAIRLFPKDYWGPYIGGFIYDHLKDLDNKKVFYTIARQR